MAKKKTSNETKNRVADPNVMGLRAEVLEQPITQVGQHRGPDHEAQPPRGRPHL